MLKTNVLYYLFFQLVTNIEIDQIGILKEEITHIS